MIREQRISCSLFNTCMCVCSSEKRDESLSQFDIKLNTFNIYYLGVKTH